MPHIRARHLAAVLTASALALTAGCAKGEDTGGSGGGGGTSSGSSAPSSAPADAAQVPKETSGPQCTADKYGIKKVDLKDAVVGFSQSEKEANPFRIAETQSIKDEAAKLGVKKLLTTNAQSQLPKQIADIQDMLAQGAQVLIVAPLNSTGLEPALQAAKAKGVPVVTVDRKLDGATSCTDYLTFIGSDFTEQGKRAADQLIKVTEGKGKVAILLGSPGNNVTTQRTKGFVDQVKAEAPGMQIVAQQTGDFSRDKGQSVTEQIIQSQPDLTAIYAENDEMALGAVTALKAAGKTPGKDVKVVSIDGTRNAVQGIVDGSINGVIESNPRFGPLAFKAVQDLMSGSPVSENIVIKDREYDESNAKDSLASAY